MTNVSGSKVVLIDSSMIVNDPDYISFPFRDKESLLYGILIGAASAFAIVWFYGVFNRLLFGRNTVRGQPPEHAPGSFIMTSFGRVHYILLEKLLPNGEQRPLVVLIHGFAGSCDVFVNPSRSRYAIELHQAGFDVLTFDNYGHGFSDGPDTDYSVELYSAQLAEMLVALEMAHRKFYLLGLSMGASIAVSFAHRHGEKMVKRLILQAPSVMEEPLDLRLRIALRVPFIREIATRILVPTFGEGANLNNHGVVRAAFRLLMTKLHSGGSWGKGDEGSTTAMLAELKDKLSHPVFVMWGEKDSVVPISFMKELLDIVPSAQVVVQPEADHMDFADGEEDIRKFFRQYLVDYCLDAEQSDYA